MEQRMEIERGLGRKSFLYATLNRHKRLAVTIAPLKVFDKENVLFSMSSEGLSALIMQAELEESMRMYEGAK